MKHVIATMSLVAVMTACGQEPIPSTASQTQDDIGSGSVEIGRFKLYPQPNTASQECDTHVRLQLINGFVSPVATLRREIAGVCEAVTDAQPFNLKEQPADCGSRRYVGGRFQPADAGTVIGVAVIDNRHRTCDDNVVSQIIVNETFGDGRVATLYSGVDAALLGLSASAAQESGVLTRVVAMGGETTGTALTKNDGTRVEVDLQTNGLQARFVEGRTAEVTGTLQKVTGVEIPERTVLVVASLRLL